jgi:hypothetical protein
VGVQPSNRFRLELTPDGIRGAVRELDGCTRAALKFRFDKRAVTTGRPALASGGFRAVFTDVARQFGSEAAWATNSLERLKSWGFNTLPAGHSESLRYQGPPHIEFLSLGTDFGNIAAMAPKENWTGFPNVFDEPQPAIIVFGADANERAAAIVRRLKELKAP